MKPEHGTARAGPAWDLTLVLLVGLGCGSALGVYALIASCLTAGRPGQSLELFHSGIESRRRGAFSSQELEELSSAHQLFSAVTAYSPVPLQVVAHPEPVEGDFVTTGYFDALHSKFLLGGTFDCPVSLGNDPISCREVIAGAEFWRTVLGADPHVVGRTLVVANQPFRVQGILESGSNSVEVRRHPQLWVSANAEPLLLGFDWRSPVSKVRWLYPLVQLQKGVDVTQAEGVLRGLLPAPKTADETDDDVPLLLTPGQANLALVFRLRGRVVERFGAYVPVAFWTFLVVWSLLLHRLFAPRLSHRSIAWIACYGLTECALAIATYLLVRRVLVSFLWLFGSPSGLLQGGFGRMTFFWSALALAASATLGLYWASLRRSSDSGPALGHRRLVAFLDRRRYLLLTAGLALLVAGFASNGLCVSDFWQHAAVVRELATHPVHPVNPILPTPAPHVGFSPYGLLLGTVSRWSGWSAVDTLRLFGVLNFLLIAWTLRLFVRRVFTAPHTDFYALLFLVFLWGFSPWMYSGFLHFNYLVQGAPYPSTFATGLVFLAWYCAAAAIQTRRLRWWGAVVLLLAWVLLDHPITAISLCVGLFALACASRSWRSLVWVGVAFAVGFGLAITWPYFPVTALWLGKSATYDKATAELYRGLVGGVRMTFPALLGLPLLVVRFRKNRLDFLVVAFASLLCVYAVGFVTGRFVLGRIMPFLMLMLQFTLADWMAAVEAEPKMLARSSGKWMRNLALVGVALGVLMMLPGLISTAPIYQNSYGEYAFLSRYVPQYSTVLADFDSSLKIPAFGGKVVGYAPEHVLFFVDNTLAAAATKRFFSSDSETAAERQSFAGQNADFLLMNEQKSAEWPAILRSLSAESTVVYGDGEVLLLKMAKPVRAAGSGSRTTGFRS